MTRHQREFPGSRPIPVLPLACGRHGWDSGPRAFPRAPNPADQEPAAHVAVGTGRTRTRSYVFDIRRTSSTSSLTSCDLVSQLQLYPAATTAEQWRSCTSIRNTSASWRTQAASSFTPPLRRPGDRGLPPPFGLTAPRGALVAHVVVEVAADDDGADLEDDLGSVGRP